MNSQQKIISKDEEEKIMGSGKHAASRREKPEKIKKEVQIEREYKEPDMPRKPREDRPRKKKRRIW